MSSEKDFMAAVESCDEYILYKILKRRTRQVVRVEMHDPEIIPRIHRNYGPEAVEELAELPVWNDNDWSQLDVYRDPDPDPGKSDIRCVKDQPPFLGVPKDSLCLDRYPTCNFFDLTIMHRLSLRVYEVSYRGTPCILKTTNFPFELPWVIREIEAYHAVAKCPLVPEMLAYVSETSSQDRVSGFLVEKLEGHAAGPGDLGPCLEALGELHRFILHGDLTRYNMMITEQGPKFLDLEGAVVLAGKATDKEDRDALKKKECHSLVEKLKDESGRGRPFSPGDFPCVTMACKSH